MKLANQEKPTRLYRYLVFTLALFTFLFSFTGCSKKTPRETLDAAYKKTFSQENPKEVALGLSEITQKLDESPAHSSGFSFVIQELSNDYLGEYAGILSGLGINVDTASDLPNRKLATLIDITYGGTTYLSLEGQLRGSKIHIMAPQLLDGSASVDFSTLKDDLKSDSALAQLFDLYDISLPENLFSPISLMSSDELSSAWEVLDNAVIVEQADTKEVSLPKNVSAKKVYYVTIPEEAYSDFTEFALDSLLDSVDSFLTNIDEPTIDACDRQELEDIVNNITKEVGDIVLTVGVTKDGYISYVECNIEYDTDTYTLTSAFTGKKSPLEEVDLLFEADVNGEVLEFGYTESFDSKSATLSFSANLKWNNDTLLDFSAEGTFTDIEKGEKYTLDFDYLELEIRDLFSVSAAGTYYIDTTRCDISTPVGKEYELFSMSEQDFDELDLELRTNLKNDRLLSRVLELIGIEL